MEANRRRNGGDETPLRMLHIVYFLSWNGKMEQPHLISLHNQNNNAVHLRDFKRRLSELRGREIPDSFAWSYKRKYKTGYIWQDVTDEDLIIPTTNREYVLKGSLLLPPVKITSQIKEEKKAKPSASSADKFSTRPITEMNKESSIETLASTSSSSSEKADRRTAVLKVDAWREDIERLKKQMNEEISIENEMKFNRVRRKKSDGNSACKWGSIMSNLLNCRTVEMRDSIIRVASNQSGRRSCINSINEKMKGVKSEKNVGERASSSSAIH